MNKNTSSTTQSKFSHRIKEKALQLGFDLVGITQAKTLGHSSFFEEWLQKGFAGEMSYLEKGKEKRRDPYLILEGVKSIICCALNYYTQDKPNPLESHYGQISSYAWGRDYHKVMLEKLEALEKFIHEEIDPLAKTKSYVDTGPILERSYAQEAGLGWIGKNTCLINPEFGSWVFLGEILTDLEFAYDGPFQFDHCGTCTRCLDACPTGALKEPRVLDATTCISYLTIEHRGRIPEHQRAWLGNHISGCDICQEVCPWNHQPIPTSVQNFYPRQDFNREGPGLISLEDIAALTPEEFQKLFFESPVKRLKYEGLIRNAVIAMGNSGNKDFVKTLKVMRRRILDATLQENIEWALSKLGMDEKAPAEV